MPTSESIKEIASKLAKELKPKISNKSSHPYAWLFVHAAEKDRFLIRDRLLEVLEEFWCMDRD